MLNIIRLQRKIILGYINSIGENSSIQYFRSGHYFLDMQYVINSKKGEWWQWWWCPLWSRGLQLSLASKSRQIGFINTLIRNLSHLCTHPLSDDICVGNILSNYCTVPFLVNNGQSKGCSVSGALRKDHIVFFCYYLLLFLENMYKN